MIQTVRLERLRAIEDVVLVPQLVGDVFEVLIQIADLEREESLAAGLGCEIVQHFVAIGFDARDVGGNGVNR